MPIERDQKVDSGDNGYNGALRFIVGTVVLAAGAAVVPLPASVLGARCWVNYTAPAFTAANAGILQADVTLGTLQIASSNVADDNEVQYIIFCGEGV